MRKLSGCLLLLVLTAFCGVADSESQESGGQGRRVETKHLVLEWVDAPDSTEIAGVMAEAKRLYGRVADLLGHEPQGKVTIVLGGFAEKPGRAREYPRVDPMRRILLFKYVPDYTNGCAL